MIGLIGKKVGHTRVYTEDGTIVPVTVVQAGPNRVVQLKTEAKDGYSAVQLGFDDQKESRLNRPLKGHFRKHSAKPTKRLREFRDYSIEVKEGDELNVGIFAKGDFIDAIGLTKGRGFQGVMKRWNFGGGPGSHGQKGWSRRPGSIGACATPGWVDKGKKMPGHMGQRRRTVQNLQVVDILEDENVLLIKGSIPGANGDYIVVRESKKKPKKS